MRKSKKILSMVIFSLACIGLFAQNKVSLIEKAKSYENDKKYIYAIATYYDAIAYEPSQEAFRSYKKLTMLISDGIPGVEDYDEFSLYDSWLSLLVEFEQYWTEHPGEVFSITIGELAKDKIDYSTRTAIYSIPIYISSRDPFTHKFSEIANIICSGLEKVWKEDWEGIPQPLSLNENMLFNAAAGINFFPYVSVMKSNSYEKTGVATIDGLYTYTYSTKHYWENGVAEEGPEKFIHSWIAGQPIYYFFAGKNLIAYERSSMINLKIEIIDYEGKSLLKSNWFNVTISDPADDNCKKKKCNLLIFENVSKDIMAVIDSGEFELKICEGNLTYGRYLTGKAKTDLDLIPKCKFLNEMESSYFIGKMSRKVIPTTQFDITQKCKMFENNVNNIKLEIEKQIINDDANIKQQNKKSKKKK